MSPSSYCPNCGAANSSDSIFCEQCGYQMLTGSRGTLSSPNMRGHAEIPKYSIPNDSYSTRRHYRRYRNRHSHKAAKIAFVVIFCTIVLIGGAMLLFPMLDTSYKDLGQINTGYHSYDNPAMTEAEFIIDNTVGGVHVFFTDNYSDQLVWINMNIAGRSDVSIEDAAQFETYSYGNRTLFIFNSVDRTLPNSQWNDYSYDILIELSTQIIGSFDIHVSSGEIYFHSGVDARVNELILDTTAGEITTDIHGTTFMNTQGKNVIETVSGSIYPHFIDLEAENTTSWNIKSVSGSINLEMFYSNEPLTSIQVNFDLETISGDISYQFSPYLDYNTSEELSLGYTMDASTLTGSIGLLDFGNETASIIFPYTSLTYGSALLNFDLSFKSVSGSITIWKR